MSLEESKTKYEKLQQLLAIKIFQSDPKNENLQLLLNIDIVDLFSKYETKSKYQDSDYLDQGMTIVCTIFSLFKEKITYGVFQWDEFNP